MSLPMYIYVAGLLSRNKKGEVAFAIDYLENVSQMTSYALDILHKGHVPFCPALDFMFFIINHAQARPRITEKQIKLYSMMWLYRCDAILMTPGWEMSPGSRAELEAAKLREMKVYYDISEVPDADSD